MGLRRTVACAASVAVVMAGVALAPPAAAMGESLLSVGVTPGVVAVDGFTSADVTLAVGMTLGSPVTACSVGETYGRFAARPVVTLTRAGGATGVGIDDAVQVPLTVWPGGDPNATTGVWQGTWKVTSPRNGTWTVTSIDVCTVANAPSGWHVDPRAVGFTRTLTVTGTNVPRITVGTSTAVWGSSSIVARVALRDGAGGPVVGRQVAFGSDNFCGVDGDSGVFAVTGVTGVASKVMDPNVVMCAYVVTPESATLAIDRDVALVYKRFFAPRLLFRSVTATPLRSTLPRRTTLTIVGAVSPSPSRLGYPVTVTLYKRVSASSWRAVGSANARSTGRYTVTTRPQLRGRVDYRAVATSTRPGLVATGSATFRIRVT